MALAKQKEKKYFFIASFLGLLVLAFFMLKPFFSMLLGAMIIAYIFSPMYRWFYAKTGSELWSSIIIVSLIFLMLTIPVAFIANSLYGEISSVVGNIQTPAGTNSSSFSMGVSSALNDTLVFIDHNFPSLDSQGKKTSSFLLSGSSSIPKMAFDLIKNISSWVIAIFITLFMTFFFLKDGKDFFDYVKSLFVIEKHHQKKIVSAIERSVHAILYGTIVVALVQGMLAGIGYWVLSLFGAVKSPILLAILTAFFALIPSLGTGIVWLPVSLIIVAKGFFSKDISFIVMGCALIAYGALVVSTIDNVLRAKIIGARASIHPLIVFIGVLGGLKLFGFIGMIVGPVIFAVLIEIIKMQKDRQLF